MDIKFNIIKVFADNLDGDETKKKLEADDNLLNIELNSISFIKIIVGIENMFDIEFDDEALDYSKFVSLDTIVKYVQQKIQGKLA